MVYKLAIGECSKNRKMYTHWYQEFEIGRQNKEPFLLVGEA